MPPTDTSKPRKPASPDAASPATVSPNAASPATVSPNAASPAAETPAAPVAILDLATGRVREMPEEAARKLIAEGKARRATPRDRALAGL